MEETFFFGCPFGVFGLDGSWRHNSLLKLSEQEQREHNESIGVFPFAKQSTSWLADGIKNGLVKHG